MVWKNVPPFQNYYIIAIFGFKALSSVYRCWISGGGVAASFRLFFCLLGLKMTCIAAGRLLQQPGWILSGLQGSNSKTWQDVLAFFHGNKSSSISSNKLYRLICLLIFIYIYICKVHVYIVVLFDFSVIDKSRYTGWKAKHSENYTPVI